VVHDVDQGSSSHHIEVNIEVPGTPMFRHHTPVAVVPLRA
jgi:hypothetical protein